jgi:hypothetical protein
MAISGHTFDLNKKTLAKIEHLLPRLKYSVFPSKIIKWLENFEENEIDFAIDLLSVFEYIPFDEFMFRLNDLLFKILENIPDDEKIIIFPYGKVGKSGTLVTYPIKNTASYKNRQNDILLTHDIENVKNLSGYKHIIFIDDFIGSGKTFIEEYKKVKRIKHWIDNNQFKGFYLLSAIIMEEGKIKIEDAFSEIKIRAEVRNKIFKNGKSPLTAFKNVLLLKTMASKYGKLHSHIAPLGFDDGQSLISFFHGTPDNTLPIIWVETKNWNAIYPREPKIRMDEAKEFKKGIAFYIGICNRLGIDIYNGKTIIEQIEGESKRVIKYNTKQHHSVISLLTLKNEGYDDLIICHILGLTMTELVDIYSESKRIGFIDELNNINNEGNQFLKELKEKTKKEDFREAIPYKLMFKNEFYMPKSFKGKT